MNPEIYTYLMDLLFSSGALDVYLTNIIMKKNRPGVKLSVLCNEDKSEIIEDVLFKETTTLGIRRYNVDRSKLERQFIKLKTCFGTVTVKLAYKNGKILKYSPEYEECKEIAEEFNMPLRKVYDKIMNSVVKYFNL